MEIIARHYETLRASYDGSRSLNIKFGPSFKRKHSQVRLKY